MKQFDEILTDAGFHCEEGRWKPDGDYNLCLIDVLRGMYQNISQQLEIEIIDEKRRDSLQQRALSSDLMDFDISVRIVHRFCALGIKSLRDVVQIRRSELLKISNIGKRSMRELDVLLDKYGLSYGDMTLTEYLDNRFPNRKRGRW